MASRAGGCSVVARITDAAPLAASDSHFHNNRLGPVAEATELRFQGGEDVVPKDRHLQSAGNFTLSVPHTVLLERGAGSHEGQPALATLRHDNARRTFTG